MKRLDPEAANTLADRYWSIHGQVDELASYLDQNFRIRGAAGTYVLKVAHPSWARADLDLENHAMMALARAEPDVAWPRVQPARNGEHLLALPIAGQSCHVRMLSFVPGHTYADVIHAVPRDQRGALHRSLGAMVARLTRGLEGFEHPAAGRAHPWNLLRLPSLQADVVRIGDASLRDTVATHLKRVLQRLPAWRSTLPMTVVHNDANDYNVIVTRDGADRWNVSSVIDFGDTCTSLRAANLAIACTYAMQHEGDPAACARDIIRGYLDQAPLLSIELESLRDLIAARICHSILMAAAASAEQPDNHYVGVSQQGMRALLEKLMDIQPDDLSGPFTESRHA